MQEMSRRAVVAGLAGFIATAHRTTRGAVQSNFMDPPPLELFDIKSLERKRADSGTAYLEFLDRDSMDLGVYHLPKGGEDRQSPHELDEVYYVAAGKAKIEVEGERRDVEKGRIIFVAARARHRFVEIKEDLTLLVFFSKNKPGTRSPL